MSGTNTNMEGYFMIRIVIGGLQKDLIKKEGG